MAGESTDGSAVGLFAVLGAPDSWSRSAHALRYKGEILPRKVPFRIIILGWGGRAFQVSSKAGTLEANTKQIVL